MMLKYHKLRREEPGSAPRQYEVRLIDKNGESRNAILVIGMIPNTGNSVVSMLDITERKSAEAEVIASLDEIQSLARKLAAAEENERERLARELHDQVGQVISAIGIDLSYVAALLPGNTPPAAGKRLAQAMKSIEDAARMIRNVMMELRPMVLDDFGLAPALRWAVEEFGRRTMIPYKFTAGDPPRRFPREVETALFRISQEALTNIAKHAQATLVEVDLTHSGRRVRLVIADNGTGIGPQMGEPTTRGMGLVNMRERAAAVGGQFQVESEKGKGTHIIVEIEEGINGNQGSDRG
jgi:two-component system sensor kinase